VVGREAERSTLSTFLDKLSEGPAALMLEGQAGIGKTTLYPEWMSASDALPEMALTTRRRLLEGAARDGSLFIGFHLDRSGHVEKLKDGYRFRQQQSHPPLPTATTEGEES
jgi:hypothetical protein